MNKDISVMDTELLLEREALTFFNIIVFPGILLCF